MTTTEYITLAEFKHAVNIPQDDTSEDTRLNRIRASASRSVDLHCNRRFYLDDEVSARTYRPAGRIALDRRAGEYTFIVDDIATMSGLIVESGWLGGNGWTPLTGYDAVPENALARHRAIEGLVRLMPWPCERGSRIRVTARWGWPSVPDVVTEATLLQAGRLHKRKDSPEGVTATSEWGPIRVTKLDPDVGKLLSDLVLPSFG